MKNFIKKLAISVLSQQGIFCESEILLGPFVAKKIVYTEQEILVFYFTYKLKKQVTCCVLLPNNKLNFQITHRSHIRKPGSVIDDNAFPGVDVSGDFNQSFAFQNDVSCLL